MFVTWFGQSCFKIQSRDLTLITDPINKESGLKDTRLSNVDIITFSHLDNEERKKLKTEALVIDGPGEYEAKQIFIQGVSVGKNQEKKEMTIYRIEMEDMALGQLGPLNASLTDEQLEKFEGLDILFVPVGGNKVLSAKAASEIISQIEPRIVIPMYYHVPGLKEKLDSVDLFCKEMGVEPSSRLEKLKIQKKDLPQEEMKIIVLQNQ